MALLTRIAAGSGGLPERQLAVGLLQYAGAHAAQAHPVLIGLLAGPEPLLRLGAAQTLKMLPASPEVLQAARRGLEDPIWSVRWRCAQVLLRAGEAQGVEACLVATAPLSARYPPLDWTEAVLLLPHRATALQQLLEQVTQKFGELAG